MYKSILLHSITKNHKERPEVIDSTGVILGVLVSSAPFVAEHLMKSGTVDSNNSVFITEQNHPQFVGKVWELQESLLPGVKPWRRGQRPTEITGQQHSIAHVGKE